MALVRLPRVVTVARQAFDPETFDAAEEDRWLASIDKAAAREAVVRFRHRRDPESGEPVLDTEGKPQRESNSRVVQWSDGSLTLHVGSETFSLRRAAAQPGAGGGGGAGAGAGAGAGGGGGDGGASSDFVYARVVSVPQAGDEEAAGASGSGGRRETLLEAQAAVTMRLAAGAFVGSSVINASVLETRFSRSRAEKRSRVPQVAVTEDPELAKQRRMREEDEAARIERKQAEGAGKARSKEKKSGGARAAGAGADDGEAELGDDDDDDGGEGEGAVNVGSRPKRARGAKAKPRAKKGAAAPARGKGRGKAKAKGKKKGSDDEDEDEDEDGEDGSDLADFIEPDESSDDEDDEDDDDESSSD